MRHCEAPAIFALVALVCTGCSRADMAEARTHQNDQRAAATPRETTVAIAVDFSRSFAPFDTEKRVALDALMEGVRRALTERWPAGTIYVSAIGTSSIRQQPPCGRAISYRQALITSKLNAATDVISSRNVLERWMVECVGQLVKRSSRVEEYTDISGAVALAGDWARDVDGQKLLCVFSDFVEDLPKSSQQADFRLKGERVLMLWSPQSGDTGTPNELFRRLDDWEKRFRQAGAPTVLRAQIAGLTADRINAWIQ